VSVSIGTIIAICSLIVAFLGYQLSTNREIKADTKDTGKLEAGIEYVKKGVDEIRIELKANEKQMGKLEQRVATLEQSTKDTNRRIDEIKKESD